tara:strand:- start:135 stop:302 length:168 start_codon:yes stop_codon:yes gene_type:complete
MNTSDTLIINNVDNRIKQSILSSDKDEDKILCNHCLRTASNGIRCRGICVADNDY